MTDLVLTQSEADALIAMPKFRVDDQEWEYPGLGGKVSVPLIGRNKRENFILDVSRSRIDFAKETYQNRARQTMILVRIDFGSAPHRNPDGEEIPTPHIHLYREGYGDKWAFPVPSESFPNVENHWETLHDFMRYCNITDPPIFLKGLFT
jgi:hypothetical protein